MIFNYKLENIKDSTPIFVNNLSNNTTLSSTEKKMSFVSIGMISTEKIQIVLQIFYCTTWHTQQHTVNNVLHQNLSSSGKMHAFIMPVLKKLRQKWWNHCILSIKKHRKAMCQKVERDSVTKPTNLYLVKRTVSHVKDNHIVCYYCLLFPNAHGQWKSRSYNLSGCPEGLRKLRAYEKIMKALAQMKNFSKIE